MPTLNSASANSQANNFGSDFGNGTLTLYSGTPPANAGAPLSGNTALVVHNLSGFGSASNGVITADPISDEEIDTSGTVTFGRMIASGLIVQLSAGTSSAEIILSSTSYVDGGISSINSLTVTQPSA